MTFLSVLSTEFEVSLEYIDSEGIENGTTKKEAIDFFLKITYLELMG